ncbi:efflux RND transporter periplasmic adaptor subunit [Aliivibrio kagoshimensis]|uniref:efflux RND transporter periplasmic adaptor subunit n=1 Tax=Aliivibrio kagoshimensis TaxID=2910230 RepID=UPI003D1079CB
MRTQHIMTLLFAIVVTGCGQAPEQKELTVPIVKTITIDDSAPLGKIYFPAVAAAADRAQLSFRVSGEINELNVKAGDFVSKGDVIAALDPNDYKLAVDNSRARFSAADTKYVRSKKLVTKGLLAKSQFDELAAERQIALAELEIAKLNLSFTELKAPMDGIISRVSVEQFENIQVAQQIVNIHNKDSVDITIQVPDKLYSKHPNTVGVEDVVALVITDDGESYPARIKEFTMEPDPDLGSFLMTLTMPMPEDKFILDGMAVDVTADNSDMKILQNRGFTLPVEALFNGDGDELLKSEKYVWLVDDNSVAHKTRVVTEKMNSDGIRVLEGIKIGDRVVTAGLAVLQDGLKVSQLTSEAK